MDVEFSSKALRKHVIMRPDGDDIKIVGGRATTQDKDEIEYLLSHPSMQRGDIEMATQPELVNEYLEGDEPDKLDKEVLSDVTKEGLKQLADYFRIQNHGYMPAVMKNMLVGRYIDNKTKEILDAYQVTEDDEKVDDVLERAMEHGVVEHRKPWYVFVPMDKGIGRNPSDATKWLVTNKDKLEEEIQKLKGDSDATE